MRILVADDDTDIASIIKSILVRESYAVDTASDGRKAYDMLHNEEYDLLLLDLMMPYLSGENLLRQIRSENLNTPVIVLTAKDSTSSKIEMLGNGADDYISKPFELDEVVARVKTVIRRAKHNNTLLEVDNLVLDPSTYRVERNGTEIELSAKEFALLEFLMRNQGNIVKETQIISHVWDREYDGLSNIVAVYIKYLRKKIDDPFPHLERLIKTVRGFGYKIST
ncbi:MAG: response regulator transcription factor [bacterium]